MKTLVKSTVLLALLATTACGGGGSLGSTPPSANVTGNNSAPLSDNVAGNYSGPLSDNFGGAGTITLALSQSGSSLSGTAQDTFAKDALLNSEGSVSGSINGSTLQLTVTPNNPNACSFAATATVASNGQINGTYAAQNCSVSDSGTFTVTKQ
jgi:predicted small lipoprotein YifL